MHDRGIPAYPVDICLFPSHNILDSDIEHKLLHLLQTRRVKFFWAGLPRTSFSTARKDDGLGPGPLRDSGYVQGLPYLSANDRQKVETGNRILRVTLRLLTVCEQYRIPYALENPSSSYAWMMPQMQRFVRDFQPTLAHLHYCQFGELWKKPTTIMGKFWNVEVVSRVCTPIHGICSYSHRKHVRLQGRDSEGVFMTLRAQPYPQQFAALVAQQFSTAP